MYFKYSIFIEGNTPSLKNSKIATSRGVFPSKTVKKYLQALGVKKYSCSRGTVENYKTKSNLFEEAVVPMKEIIIKRESPHKIGLFFIRNSKRKFDWINAAQIICDLLTAHGVIEDDNMDYLIPMPIQVAGSWYTVDKERPGCIIFF
jgi:DNA-directed RNA polymerase subunit N (RpoN/RPB10)